MNRKQRQHIRAVANGEVFMPRRKSAMPSPKIIQLKNKYRRNKKVDVDDYI